MTRRSLLLFPIAATVVARPVRGARMQARRVRASGERETNQGPLRFELAAEERWPIRGLDPVLHIGGVAIESYQFGNAENTLLVFTCYDSNQLQDGATVFLRFGQDESSRTDFPNFNWANVR